MTLCIKRVVISVFDDDMRLRRPTDAEAAQFVADPDVKEPCWRSGWSGPAANA